MTLSGRRVAWATKWLALLTTAALVAACGGGGGGSSNVAPTVVAGADQTVNEVDWVTVSATASDTDGSVTGYAWTQTGGPAVGLNSSNTDTVQFAAPGVSVPTTVSLRITVTDNGGATASDTVVITVLPVAGDNTAPIARAGTDLTTSSGQPVSLNGSVSSDPDGFIASYAWTQTGGTLVALSSATSATPGFTAPNVNATVTLTFRLVVTDNEGLASAPDSVVVTVTPTPTSVTLSGKITFDLVPPDLDYIGLNYPGTRVTPAAGIRVHAIAVSNGAVLASADTNNSGDYSMSVPVQTNMFVRARAQMVKTGAPDWDFTVVDNNGERNPVNPPVYALVGASFNSALANRVENLHAASGWGGTSYTAPRAAAPFSILYAVKKAVDLVVQADATASFSPLVLNWSPNNSVAAIGTSFYDGTDIYLLGLANEDTEEYDHAVIVHEWGHYFEDVFSRADSVGGSHQGGDVLDARVAFGEGWGNAFQSMARGDSRYFDTGGTRQSSGFSFDLEGNCESAVSWGPRGWFNECSVQSLLYDIFDAASDGSDVISIGFSPIYNVLVGPQMATRSLTTVHSFSTFLREQNPGSAGGIDGLLNYHNIVSGAGITEWGTGETNDGSPRTDGLDASVVILPIYQVGLTVGVAKNVCVDVDPSEGDYNKLGNRQFIRFTVPSSGNYQITATTTSQTTGVTPDPDMVLYDQGATHYAFDAPNPVETFCGGGASFDSGTCVNGLLPLQAGVNYVLEVQDDNDLSYDLNPANIGKYCMNVVLTRP